MDKETVFISAVVYSRNNADAVVSFTRALAAHFDENFANYEIIVVDDCSAADVREELRAVSADSSGSLSVVRMSFPQGKQSAMNAGIDVAIGDFVFEFESAVMDFDVSLISEVYRKELEGYDIVSAVPQKGTKLSSKLFYRIYNKNSNSQYPLSSERFRLVSRRAINRVESMSDTLVYRKAFYSGSGLKCASVCYTPKRSAPSDSLPRERSRLATDSFILFTSVAHKLSLFMTILMMFFAAFSGIYTLVIYILGKPTEGWTTLMLLLSFAFFGVFALLTIVIKYLSVLLDITFKKNRYSIENVYRMD